MPYRLVYTKRAVKDIEKLDVVVKKLLKKVLEELTEDPTGKARKLINLRIGEYRYRKGNYRIIFDLLDDEIIILRIGHRKEIYRS